MKTENHKVSLSHLMKYYTDGFKPKEGKVFNYEYYYNSQKDEFLIVLAVDDEK